MKTSNADASVRPVLEQLCGRVPFLKVKSFQATGNTADTQPDYLMELDVEGRTIVLGVQVMRHGQPREVRTGLLQLQRFLDLKNGTDRYGLIVAPFLSQESAKLCDAAGAGYVDFAGNAKLSFDRIFIETRTADNPFREKRHLRSLFSPKAARILRVLLTPPLRAWRVTELEAAAGVSLGQVSNVRKLLLDYEWAAISENGLYISQPEEMARAWQKSYEVKTPSSEAFYTILHGENLDAATKAALAEAGNGEHLVLASYSAARWIAPYARQATQFFYADADGTHVLKHHLQLQPVSSGGNIVIMEPQENDVFSARLETAPGIWCSGLVQTWLDLSTGGERGAQAAEHLLQQKLLPVWKAVSL